ncbi:hypothetical protein EYZ11_003670 [Aspergillus tanneri]|uniref:Xylose isomerase-like TIM barrel domain-containing protein n=1 Tax=Aspergillus tanneri TaxID=1220188 RepID=A0A4S3JML6_9EURO|nr:uncharacterized protein ATNIH1004_006710 [Aspergillus tanneri]KAA8645291.1 hypothetical protein ATNIH1004_006710 [Aspergillus tanneri]THC96846.1 hypothetical protein EYZ11_003670 [Aspergillus tanneri]
MFLRTETSGYVDLIIQNLREIADLGAPLGIRFTYEALSWGTHVDTWEKCCDIVTRVDRPNFGICLDAFNLAGRVSADPGAGSGMAVDALAAMKTSLERLGSTINIQKLFWVQVVDAEKMDHPLEPNSPYYVAGQPSRMSCSRNCRLFYGKED